MDGASCRHGRQHLRELDGRDQGEALADGRVERVAQIPLFLQQLLLDRRAGDDAGRLAGQRDARLFAEAVLAGILVQCVDAHAAAHFVKIHVIRHGEGPLEIQPAQRFAAGIAHIDEPVAPRVENQFLRTDLMRFQACRTGDDLEGRTGGVFAVDDLVVQRMMGIVVDAVPVFGRNTADEPVRIEVRPRGQGFHRPRIGIHGHGRGRLHTQFRQVVVHGVFQRLLQPVVDGQHQVPARPGRLPRQLLDHPAPYVDLLGLAAVHAAQIPVVHPFQTVLADDAALGQPLVAAPGHLFFRNFAHVPEHMGGQAGIHVPADGLRIKRHAGQVPGILFQDRDFLHAQFRLEGYRFVGLFRFRDFRPDVLLRHAQNGGEPPDFVIRQLVPRHDGQHEGRYVIGQDNAVAIVDLAARRHEEDAAHAVSVRLGAVIQALVQLQPRHAPHKDHEGEKGQGQQYLEPAR